MESARAARRISDHDRDAVLRRLERAVAEGRLTLSEFEERSSATLQARTRGDLDEVTSDLPPDRW